MLLTHRTRGVMMAFFSSVAFSGVVFPTDQCSKADDSSELTSSVITLFLRKEPEI